MGKVKAKKLRLRAGMGKSSRTHGKRYGERAESQGIKLVCPDGGWGWVVVAAFAITHFFAIPVYQLLGLIFADKFRRLGITTTDISTLFNVNSAIGFGFGLIMGPLLSVCSYRLVSFCGALLLVVGTCLTALANSMTFYVIAFSIISALGFVLASQSQGYALNLFFLKKRVKAHSLGVALCGLGSVIMPLLASASLRFYGSEGTVLLMGALLLHALPASLLLQPITWHRILPPETNGPVIHVTAPEDDDAITVKSDGLDSKDINTFSRRERTMTIASIDPTDTPMLSRSCYLHGDDGMSSSNESLHSLALIDEELAIRSNLWNSDDAVHTTGGKTRQVMLAENELTEKTAMHEAKKTDGRRMNLLARLKRKLSKFGRSVTNFFDLRLLFLPGYLSIAVGTSLLMFIEVNFSVLLPFILREYHGLNTEDIASILAVMGACDIVFRFLAPYVEEAIKLSDKSMLIVSIMILVILRTLAMVFGGFGTLMVLGCGFGVGKGLRTVFVYLIIPGHVPIERLAAAKGLQLLINGLLFLICGPLLGALKDYTGSYIHVVIILNFLSLGVIVEWSRHNIKEWCGHFCNN